LSVMKPTGSVVAVVWAVAVVARAAKAHATRAAMDREQIREGFIAD
jgi:hypothetical protein